MYTSTKYGKIDLIQNLIYNIIVLVVSKVIIHQFDYCKFVVMTNFNMFTYLLCMEFYWFILILIIFYSDLLY